MTTRIPESEKERQIREAINRIRNVPEKKSNQQTEQESSTTEWIILFYGSGGAAALGIVLIAKLLLTLFPGIPDEFVMGIVALGMIGGWAALYHFFEILWNTIKSKFGL